MSRDPLALAAIAAGAPQEAEYDAVCAAVTATERGRWFLTEYGNRNRHAETHLVLAAIARIEAAIRGDVAPQSSIALWRDLTGIAATIEQARAAIAAEDPRAAAVSGALERIQDLAFGLRERAVDAALCDALDAAAREISDASADRATSGKSAPKVTELLCDLAARVDTLIQLSLAEQASNGTSSVTGSADLAIKSSPAPVGEIESSITDPDGDNDLSRSPLFAMDLQEGQNLTATVAALATSLTNAASALDPKSGREAVIMSPSDDAESSNPSNGAPADGGPRWYIEAPDFVFNRSVLEPEQRELTGPSGKTRALLPETGLPLEPHDDPGNVSKDAGADIATVPIAAPESFAVTPATAEDATLQHRIANGPVVRVIGRPSPGDSLAAMRDLSAEELIALFG